MVRVSGLDASQQQPLWLEGLLLTCLADTALLLMLPLQVQGLQQLCHRLTMYPEVSMVP